MDYLIVFDLYNWRKRLIRETKNFMFFRNDGDSYIYRVSKNGYKVKCIAENYQFWTKSAITVIKNDIFTTKQN